MQIERMLDEHVARTVGGPIAYHADPGFRMQITLLRRLLVILDAALEDEACPTLTRERVIRTVLYACVPDGGDAEHRAALKFTSTPFPRPHLDNSGGGRDLYSALARPVDPPVRAPAPQAARGWMAETLAAAGDGPVPDGSTAAKLRAMDPDERETVASLLLEYPAGAGGD